MSAYTYSTARVASGATASQAVDLRSQRLVAIKTPASLDGVVLTFHVSETELGTYVPLFHLSTMAATATALTSIAINQWLTLPYDKAPANCWVKVVVDAQTPAADFILTTEPCS